MERLSAFGERCTAVGDVRGRGLLFGVELVRDRVDFAPDNALAERAYYRCLDAGLSLKISGGNVMTLSPPLVIAREELDWALTIVEQSILAG
ncbi:aminotransferase class III-fold pyridoxal phosphate-dependent enzyme [Ensifer canadensis]